MNIIAFVVLSRDTDFIYATGDGQEAQTTVTEQTKREEMAGGRPSVYYKPVMVHNIQTPNLLK